MMYVPGEQRDLIKSMRLLPASPSTNVQAGLRASAVSPWRMALAAKLDSLFYYQILNSMQRKFQTMKAIFEIFGQQRSQRCT